MRSNHGGGKHSLYRRRGMSALFGVVVMTAMVSCSLSPTFGQPIDASAGSASTDKISTDKPAAQSEPKPESKKKLLAVAKVTPVEKATPKLAPKTDTKKTTEKTNTKKTEPVAKSEPKKVEKAEKKPEPSWPKSPHIADTPHLSPEQERAKLHLPPGFEIQLVATEPQIAKPINMAFDHRGRLWVTSTVDYPFPAEEGKAGHDTIKILEDTNHDGRADKITTFADGLTIPTGLLPTPDGAIVWSVAKIYKLTDTDGDDRADKKVVLFEGFGRRDTHGMINNMTWGFDGWVYACHGFSNTSTTKGTDGHEITMNSGNTWRFRLDGSRVEHITHGQVNPFGLCFDPLGNMYTADCHSKPIYQPLRGAYYPSFGKPHDGLGYGPIMCSHTHGSTAISGITYYAAKQFPEPWRDTIFIGNVVTRRVNHDKIEWHGSSPKAIEQPDFIKSDDPWFRPVDIQLGPDGAMYIADFYNRIIGHYEVPLDHPGRDRTSGRIWRIVYTGDGAGVAKQPRSDWAKAGVAELIDDLDDPNLWVRTEATNQLVLRVGGNAVKPLRAALDGSATSFQKIHGLWALARLGALQDGRILSAGKDADRAVRVHVQRILSERSDWSEPVRAMSVSALKDPDALVRRCAADALGRHARAEQLRPLLDMLAVVPKADTHLRHVARMAIRDHFRLSESWAWLARQGTDADRGAAANVAPGLTTPDSAVFLLEYVQTHDVEGTPDRARIHHIARYLPEDRLESFYSLVRNTPYPNLRKETGRVRAVHGGLQKRGIAFNEDLKQWANDVVERLLNRNQGARTKEAIELIQRVRLTSQEGRLASFASDKGASAAIRRPACEALVALNADAYIPLLAGILSDVTESPAMRDLVIRLLGGIQKPAAVETLAAQLRTASQRDAIRIAVALARSKAGGERLLEAIETGKATARLLKDRDVENAIGRHGIADLETRVAALTQNLPPLDDRITKLMKSRKAGFVKAKTDPTLGAKLFEERCGVCHQIGSVGKKIGPELNGIGMRGLDRILEDVFDPSRNVDQAFRSSIILLKNNLIRTGLLQSDEGEALVLVDEEGKTETIAKSDVQARKTSSSSPMPANLAESIPENDFYNLIAFLLAQKQTASQPAGKSGVGQ